ncbi:CIC11C00000005191 [Sungouiella intermedia]|uniref:CIC11C00000005191 n=1 Tax=Sungouiella intermedia TaxID=45354 RepID=A0A1L0FUC9_9ASCO|nr:CIC11C00000005191 [[Candida] intermedia]
MRVINTALNLFFLSGTTLVLIFLVLSGSTNHFPFNRFYWLKADTSGISGAPTQSSWTFWGVCDSSNFGSCQVGPAFPISPVDNFGTSAGVPKDFISNRDTYYYLSRFAFAFILLGLAFTGFALIVDLLGFCFVIIDKVVIFLVVFALFFIAGAAALQTAVSVLARNAFQDANLYAHIGVKSTALLWAAFAGILIVFFNTCAANIHNSYKKHIDRVRSAHAEENEYYPPAETQEPVGEGALGDESSYTRANVLEKETGSGGIRFFRIKRNQKASDEESV